MTSVGDMGYDIHMMETQAVREVPVSRITPYSELPNGETFIGVRPSRTPGKVVVRLFDRHDKLVTRLWNSNATILVGA